MIFELWPEGILACFLACLYPFFLQLTNKTLQFVLLVSFILFGLLLESRSLCIIVVFLYLINQTDFKLKIHKPYKLLLFIGFVLVCAFINTGSIVGRFFIWEIIIKNSPQIPIFGFGFNSFKEIYATWQIEYFGNHKDFSIYHKLAESPSFAFNEIFHYYIEFGVGFILVIGALMTLNIKALFIKKNKLTKACALSNLIIFSISLVSYPLHSIWIILIFSINHIILILNFFRIRRLIIVCTTTCTVLLFLYPTQKYFRAKSNWQYAKMIPYAGYNEKLNLFENTLDQLNNNQYFLNDYSNFLLVENDISSFFKISQKFKKYFNQYEYYILTGNAYLKSMSYNNANINFQKAHLLVPMRFIPLYNLMKIAVNTNNINQAKNYAEIITKMPIKIENPISTRIKEEALLYLQPHSP